ERLRRSAHRGGMRRVEHLEQLALERAPENLRREARAAHTEEDECVELPDRAARELLQLADALAHSQRLVEPPEPAVFVAPGPERGVSGPEALDELRRGDGSSRAFRGHS